jgi:hypothetical protein
MYVEATRLATKSMGTWILANGNAFFFFFFLSDVKKVVVGSKKMPKSSTHLLVRLQTAPGKRKAHGCEPSPLAHFCG